MPYGGYKNKYCPNPLKGSSGITRSQQEVFSSSSCSSMPSDLNRSFLLFLWPIPIETLDVLFLSQVCLSIWNFLISWLHMPTLPLLESYLDQRPGLPCPKRKSPICSDGKEYIPVGPSLPSLQVIVGGRLTLHTSKSMDGLADRPTPVIFLPCPSFTDH